MSGQKVLDQVGTTQNEMCEYVKYVYIFTGNAFIVTVYFLLYRRNGDCQYFFTTRIRTDSG